MTPVTMPFSTPPKSPKVTPPSQNGDPFAPFWPSFIRPAHASRAQTTKHIVQSTMYPINEALDEFFYNVSEGDKQAVHTHAKEAGVVIAGSIVYLAPEKPPKFFPDVFAFLTSPEKDEVRALCIPGVGSSVLGSVGLARDVALARKVPVAGLVAGYGFRELLNDAIGGFFYFRETNQLEFVLENMRRGLSSMVAGLGLLPDIETNDSIAGGPTLLAMKALLRDKRLPRLEFLVGHSKGNLVISGALSELVCENAPISQLDNVTIVMLSAVCALPKVGRKQVQIIGALDGLGLLNSRPILPDKIVPNAAHHLNRAYPLYLDAVAELASL